LQHSGEVFLSIAASRVAKRRWFDGTPFCTDKSPRTFKRPGRLIACSHSSQRDVPWSCK
jgi:hypothetical protein